MNESDILRQRLHGALTREPRINLDRCELDIQVSGATVTLAGTVPSVAARRLAPRIAAATEGVAAVEDRLRVAVSQPMGDLEIGDHLRRSFDQEANLESGGLEIGVDPDGAVTLGGAVHSLVQRRLAEVLAWWIPGVSEVRNRIVIEPAEEDNDEELRDNLLVILEKDPLVDPTRFRLDVRDGTVTLRGRVPSATEADAAERTCWYTPGVKDVRNELEAG